MTIRFGQMNCYHFAPRSTQPSILRGRYMSTICGWEGKGRYGSFCLQMKRRVCR